MSLENFDENLEIIRNIIGDKATSILSSRFNSLHAIGKAAQHPIKGIPDRTRKRLKAAFDLKKAVNLEKLPPSPKMEYSFQIADLIREDVRFLSHEELFLILLNSKSQLIKKLCKGSVDIETISKKPGIIFSSIYQYNAYAFVIAKSQTSGDGRATECEIRAAKNIYNKAISLDIKMLDYLIIGPNIDKNVQDYSSLNDLEYFPQI